MPDPQPPIFDDGGGLPQVGGDESSDWRNGPNYLVRRTVAVGVVIALAIGAGLVAGRMLSGDDGMNANGVVTTNWDTVVLVDQRSGEIVLTDDQGDERERIATGVRLPDDAAIADRTVMVLSDDEMAIVDLGATTSTSYDLAATSGTVIRPAGTAQTLVAHDANTQRAVLVHGPTGDLIDSQTFARVPAARYEVAASLADASGRHVLVTDSGNFQSVLFSFDRDEPSFFPGLALAVSDDVVVTAQNVGTDATINMFDHAGEPLQTARTPAVRAGMVANGGVVVVTVAGTVVRIDIESGSQTETAEIGGGVTVQSGGVALRGDRLVVSHDGGTTLVDDTGMIIGEFPGAAPTAAGIDATAPRRTACVVLETAAPDNVVIVELDTGQIIDEAVGRATAAISADGCTVLLEDDTVIAPDRVESLDLKGEAIDLTPGGAQIVAELDGRIVIIDPTATDDEPVDLGRTGRTVLFADL